MFNCDHVNAIRHGPYRIQGQAAWIIFNALKYRRDVLASSHKKAAEYGLH
jgi:hypothetical protein